jgi:hypothetical protein
MADAPRGQHTGCRSGSAMTSNSQRVHDRLNGEHSRANGHDRGFHLLAERGRGRS